MDHKYIDQHDIADRYLRKELAAAEREAFQAHMVDCAECADRILLAEIFQAENGMAKTTAGDAPVAAFPAPAASPKLPLRAQIAAYLSPWQLAVLFMLFVLGLLGIPSLFFWWAWQHR